MDLFRWFDTIYVMTKGGPGTATETLNMFGYLTGFNFMNVGYAASIGITMLLIITFVSKFVINLTRKG
jgi:multiple sugar transport system permease protein